MSSLRMNYPFSTNPSDYPNNGQQFSQWQLPFLYLSAFLMTDRYLASFANDICKLGVKNKQWSRDQVFILRIQSGNLNVNELEDRVSFCFLADLAHVILYTNPEFLSNCDINFLKRHLKFAREVSRDTLGGICLLIYFIVWIGRFLINLE
jgi:hypothetical protein